MSLFYVTGQAGTGKSTVCKELKHRGFNALDSDEDALARWVNKKTGYIHPKSSVKADRRTLEFLAHHDWKIPYDAVRQLTKQATHETVFLCGVGGNEAELSDLFAAMFALVIDDGTMRQRLATRPGNNAWGKQPHERDLTLGWQTQAQDDYARLGHIIIDATQPLVKVVDSIVNKSLAIEASLASQHREQFS